MGTLTEYFKYMNATPDQFKELTETLSHLRITEELKRKRREYSLWKPEPEDNFEFSEPDIFAPF